MLSRLYPLRGLPRQDQLWSWISFDVANQSFTLIVNTLLFSIFFQQVVVRNPARDDFLWTLVYGTSMALVVLASPLAGAIADARAWKKPALLLTGLLCAAFTCGLALIGPGQFWLAVLLYVPANFLFSIGENFLASFLPELAAREHFGRVSGFSWACAYTAALLLLVLTAGGMLAFGWKAPDSWRPLFVFAGLWFFAFAIPTLLFLRERPAPPTAARAPLFATAFRRLADSVGHLRRFRDVALLFAASLFYGTGMSVIIMFASILAQEFGFTDVQLVLFVAVITMSGILGTLLPTFFQDRLGHKCTTLLLLGLWIATTAGFVAFAWARNHAAVPAAFPSWPLWLIGNLVGFGLGSLGSANRAFVGYLTPATRSAEFFGLWGLVFKLAAVLTIPFGFAKDAWGTPAALLVLLGFLVVGGTLTLFVDERRGLATARAEDERLQTGAGSSAAT
ncbi:MAG TPA: MFS transporter [Opitutaceae bacterium]|nr:MFS transporter [Opitutaceae bacterium]